MVPKGTTFKCDACDRVLYHAVEDIHFNDSARLVFMVKVKPVSAKDIPEITAETPLLNVSRWAINCPMCKSEFSVTFARFNTGVSYDEGAAAGNRHRGIGVRSDAE